MKDTPLESYWAIFSQIRLPTAATAAAGIREERVQWERSAWTQIIGPGTWYRDKGRCEKYINYALTFSRETKGGRYNTRLMAMARRRSAAATPVFLLKSLRLWAPGNRAQRKHTRNNTLKLSITKTPIRCETSELRRMNICRHILYLTWWWILMIWPIQSSKKKLQPRLYANGISNLSFLSFFPTPLEKKEEKKKKENLSFATISWLPYWLLIPTDPRSLSHSGFSSCNLDSSAFDHHSSHPLAENTSTVRGFHLRGFATPHEERRV